jgi:hypothetical protein
MTVYTLAEMQQMPSVQFPKDNEIGYWMDFSYWEGIPSDRPFYITGDASAQYESCYLAADGYGARENYGNGSIMVKKTDLEKLRS